MQSKIELQNEIETNNVVKPVSYYKNYAVNPIGSVPSSLTPTTNPQLTFELPAQSLINFSRLIFSFSRGVTAVTHAAATNAAINNNYFSFLNRIEIYSGSGNLKLLDLNNADVYSKCSSHLMNEFIKNAPSNGLLYPKKASDFLPNSGIVKNAIISYQNYELSSSGADTALPANNYNIRLGDAYGDSLFNLNKTIYIAKSIFIRMTFNNTSKIVCGITTASGVPVSAVVASGAPAGTFMPVSNFALKTYTENDPLIIEQLIRQSQGGVSYVMPDIISNQISVSGAGVKGLQSKFTNMTGNADSRLYKCYSILNATGGTLPPLTVLPTSNYNNGKYSYLSLFVNSQNVLNLDVNANDDIHHMILQHANHSITDDDTVKDNGVICNIFDTSLAKKEYDIDELKGLSLNGDVTINWQYTIPTGADNVISGNANFDNYQFGIILRRIFARDGQLSSTMI